MKGFNEVASSERRNANEHFVIPEKLLRVYIEAKQSYTKHFRLRVWSEKTDRRVCTLASYKTKHLQNQKSSNHVQSFKPKNSEFSNTFEKCTHIIRYILIELKYITF